MATTAFPLAWPQGWNKQGGKEVSKFNTTMTKAHKLLSAELQRMGGSAIIISTNNPLKVDGTMRMDRDPVDPGCAVYFTRNGRQMVFAKTIEAMRGIERWGASSMMERAFTGFGMVAVAAAAPPPEEDWWTVLGISKTSAADVIEAVYKTLAKKAHPDNGGTTAAMQRLTRAREQALAARS